MAKGQSVQSGNRWMYRWMEATALPPVLTVSNYNGKTSVNLFHLPACTLVYMCQHHKCLGTQDQCNTVLQSHKQFTINKRNPIKKQMI